MNHISKLIHLYQTTEYINVQAFLFNICCFVTQTKKKLPQMGLNGHFAAKSAK